MVSNNTGAAKQSLPRKYVLTGRSVREGFKTLFQIQAVRDIPAIGVHAGDLGGFIESERNLSHDGSCWVFDNAKVCERAIVRDNATIYNDSVVKGVSVVRDYARVSGDSVISEKAIIQDYARVDGRSDVSGESVVKDNAIVGDGSMIWGASTIEDSVELRGTRAYDETYSGDDVYFGETPCPDGYIPDEYDY